MRSFVSLQSLELYSVASRVAFECCAMTSGAHVSMCLSMVSILARSVLAVSVACLMKCLKASSVLLRLICGSSACLPVVSCR
jgi:hypothetical protein